MLYVRDYKDTELVLPLDKNIKAVHIYCVGIVLLDVENITMKTEDLILNSEIITATFRIVSVYTTSPLTWACSVSSKACTSGLSRMDLAPRSKTPPPAEMRPAS